MMEQYDSEQNYCRMLGHEITFKYCRLTNNNMPCRKIMDCWFERLPVEEFIKKNYSDADIEKIFSPPKEKVATLYDLIKQAQERRS